MEASGVSFDFSFGFDDPTFSNRILLLQIVDGAETGPHTKKRRHAHTTTAPALQEKTMHINSLILAGSSPFFRKLFSNGMQESGQKQVMLRIETSEEASLIDLLKYVYSNSNSNTLPTSLHALLGLLVIADKFEVYSCLRGCTALLQNMGMTCESASLYLDLPPCLLVSSTVEPLINAAKQFLVAHFMDFDKCKEETIDLSLGGLKAVLSSDDLQVTSEGVVYDSVLEWAHKHYPDSEERREILQTHLLSHIRFPFMTTRQLTEQVLRCSDIDSKLASDIVIRALSFKAAAAAAAEESNDASRRAYKYRPVNAVNLSSPHQHCIVFLHLTRKELRGIFPGGQIMSEAFHLGKQGLVLDVKCCFHEQTNNNYFWLALKAVGPTATFPVKYELAVRRKVSEEFERLKEGRQTFTEQERQAHIVSEWWTEFIGDDSTYFINHVLHLRAVLTTLKF